MDTEDKVVAFLGPCAWGAYYNSVGRKLDRVLEAYLASRFAPSELRIIGAPLDAWVDTQPKNLIDETLQELAEVTEITLNVDYTSEETGTVTIRRTNRWSQSVTIPIEVIVSGKRAVRAYIEDSADFSGQSDLGETKVDWDNEDFDSEEITGWEIDWSTSDFENTNALVDYAAQVEDARETLGVT